MQTAKHKKMEQWESYQNKKKGYENSVSKTLLNVPKRMLQNILNV